MGEDLLKKQTAYTPLPARIGKMMKYGGDRIDSINLLLENIRVDRPKPQTSGPEVSLPETYMEMVDSISAGAIIVRPRSANFWRESLEFVCWSCGQGIWLAFAGIYSGVILIWICLAGARGQLEMMLVIKTCLGGAQEKLPSANAWRGPSRSWGRSTWFGEWTPR